MIKGFKRASFLGICSLLSLSLVSCGKEKEIDYAANLKLEHNYENKNFASDSIGEVTLTNAVDGDTIITNFGSIRFLGVDTPESTGKVEPWGKKASKFTKERLDNAEKIVLESENVGSQAATDNNNRKLAYVWYIPDGKTEFVNLNLELAQNGYSEKQINKKYVDSFDGAYAQAQRLKKGVYNPYGDPDFIDEIAEYSLKEIVEGLNTNPEAIMGAKVKVEAYVKSMNQNKANTYTIANYIDGKEYEFTLYTGYNSGEYCVVGNKVTYVGFIGAYPADSKNYQLSGLITSDTNEEGTYTKVSQTGYYVQVGTKLVSHVQTRAHHLFNDMTVSNVETKDGSLVITGTAFRRGKNDRNITVTVPLDGKESDIKKGDVISFAGTTSESITSDTMDITINVRNLTDIKKI